MASIKPYPVQSVKPFLVQRSKYTETVDMKAILASNLRAQLKARNWGQQELHRRSTVAQSTIGRILRRETAADVETIGQLAKALGLQPWVLLVPDFGETASLLASIAALANKKIN